MTGMLSEVVPSTKTFCVQSVRNASILLLLYICERHYICCQSPPCAVFSSVKCSKYLYSILLWVRMRGLKFSIQLLCSVKSLLRRIPHPECCESRYRGVPESTGEFRRAPEIYDRSEMCSLLYLHGLHELLFPPMMTSWSPPWSMVISYLSAVFQSSRASLLL